MIKIIVILLDSEDIFLDLVLWFFPFILRGFHIKNFLVYSYSLNLFFSLSILIT